MTVDTGVPPLAPGGLPLLGHAVALVRDRLGLLQRLRAHGPLVRALFTTKPVYVVNAPDLVHEMLTSKSAHFTKGLLFDKLKLFGNSALPVADGKQHLERRRAMQPLFHRNHMDGYVDTMYDNVEPTISSWRSGDTLDLKTEMQLMTQGAVMSVMFSANPPRAEALGILSSVDTIFMAAIRRALMPLELLERLPTRGNRRVRKADAVLQRTVGRIVAEHRANPDAYDDMVSLLLSLRDESGDPLPEDEILSETIGLLAAGSETTAVVLAWLFHELGRRPELEERLHEEVDAVVGNERVTAEHVARLPFVRRLVNETLRLYSPAWLVTRQAAEPVQLGPFTVPAGANMVWSAYSMHRDPALYPDPLRFDPDRWLPERPQPPKGAYIPFGTGKRQCMGDQFAVSEAVLITALIASRWRLRPTLPESAVRPIGEITVHPSVLRMKVEARQPATVREAA